MRNATLTQPRAKRAKTIDIEVMLKPMHAEQPDHFEEGDEPKPWHRQRDADKNNVIRYETVRAYALFRKYLELGDQRSYRKVAEAVGKSRTYIKRVASRWRWKERSTAYFTFLDDEQMKAFIAERKAMARRQAQTALLGQKLAVTGLEALQKELEATERRRGLTMHEIARLLDVSTKLERISRGEYDEDEVAKITVTVNLQKEPRYVTAAHGNGTEPEK